MSIVVNFFGGPGVGKSTISADLFCQLKKMDINTELVQEYVKELIWDDRTNIFNDQLYVTAKQNRRISRLKHKVDVIVTDSPIPLGGIYAEYAKNPLSHILTPLTNTIFNEYDNLNVFLTRRFAHISHGRIHDESQGIEIDNLILNWLTQNNHPYITVDSRDNLPQVIEEILRRLS